MRKLIFIVTVVWVISLVVAPLVDYAYTAVFDPADITEGELIRAFVSNFLLFTGIYVPVVLLLLTARWAFLVKSRRSQRLSGSSP